MNQTFEVYYKDQFEGVFSSVREIADYLELPLKVVKQIIDCDLDNEDKNKKLKTRKYGMALLRNYGIYQIYSNTEYIEDIKKLTEEEEQDIDEVA